MIKVGVLGDIGSGKSFVAKQFGYPVFNADKEVSDIYKNDKSCYKKIKKKFPKFIKSKSLKKNELGRVIKENKKNLRKISDIFFKFFLFDFKTLPSSSFLKNFDVINFGNFFLIFLKQDLSFLYISLTSLSALKTG